MSLEKGETSEVDVSAPLDLRVKKEVKVEPKTPVQENVPLNLSKPVLPSPAPPAPSAPPHPAPPPAKILKKEPEGAEIRSKLGGPGVRAAAPPPLVKHTTVAGNVSKTMLVRPPAKVGGPLPHQIHVVSPPDAIVTGAASSVKKQASSHVPHHYIMPTHLSPHAIALETVVGSPKMPVASNNHAPVTIGATSQPTHGGPPKSAQTSHGAPPALSPSKGQRTMIQAKAPSPTNAPTSEHYAKAPSPRSHPKKKTSPIPRESPVPRENPVHMIPVATESSAAKVSPTPKVRQEKQMSHGIHPGMPTSMDRLVTHGASPRPLGPVGPYSGNSQKHPLGHPSGHPSPGAPLPQESPSQPRSRVQHSKKSPSSPPPPPSAKGTVSQDQAVARHRLPQQLPRHASPQHVSPPQRIPVGTAPHPVNAPPVEALLRLRNPVTAVSQPEGVSLYPPRATRPLPGTLPGPHGPPPALSQAPPHPSQPPHPAQPPHPSQPPYPRTRPLSPPHTTKDVSTHSPPSSTTTTTSSSSSSSSQPHPAAPPFREMHQPERVRHPGAPGPGYVPPPPPPASSEYYPMRPIVPQPSSAAATTGPAHPPGVPPLVQTPGPMQAPGQRFPPSSTPFAVNPFVSLSIAIDCQRATEQDSDGDTALHIAIVQDKPDMGLIRRLIELVRLAGKSVDIFNFMQQTPLHLACIMKDSDIIRQLVEAGANPNEADRNGQTAAHHTCKNGTPSCLGAILRYSQVEVNLNIRNYEGYTPLHLAAMVGNPTLVTMLLEKGADLNSKDSKNGWTPLFHAVTNQDTKLVHKMLSSGAEVNVQSYSGNTVLHVATGRGYTDIVKILVHYGADMSLKNTQWDTPATITTDKNMSSLLRGLGAGSPQPNDSSSPNTAVPTLPMPLNDAYLIRPASSTSSSSSSSTYAAAAAAAAAGSLSSKSPSTVTTMTTERLKGPANEIYTVTRSVTRPDEKSPDGQRAIHKQTQEKLRHSIHNRKVVNERRIETHPRKPAEDIPPEQQAGNERLVVVPVAAGREEKDDRVGGGHPASKAVSDSPGMRSTVPTEADRKSVKVGEEDKYHYILLPRSQEPSEQSAASATAKAKSTPDVVPKIEITSPEPSKTEAPSVSQLSQKVVHKPSEKETKPAYTHQLVINVNGHLRTVPVKADNPKILEKTISHLGVPIAPKGTRTQPRKIAQKEPASNSPFTRHSPMEAALISSALIAPDIAAVSSKSSVAQTSVRSPVQGTTATSESENEVRARMLSLQYKNSDAILGNRYERKLDSVGTEQEHEVANTILTIRSRLQQQELERQQKQAQTCDADSTVKTEPVSPTPVLSSTTSETSSGQSQSGRSLSPPVLEREGDRPVMKSDDDDDVEPNLIIDESLKTKSQRKRTRTPTKSIPNLSPAKSSTSSSSSASNSSLNTTLSSSSASEYVATSSDSVKLGKVRVTGDPKKLWTKMAMMGNQEPKRKRKKSEKTSKEN